MEIRKGEKGHMWVCILYSWPQDDFLYCGVTGTNEMQIESKKGKKMMGYTVIGTP